MLKKFRFVTNPIFVLVAAQICWGLLMFVWIRWYILRSQEINNILEKIPLPKQNSGQWVILMEGCILMAFILVGLYMIFVNQRRLSRLAKMQDAILSSVTHELKTPLASIRLYTETMLLRTISEADKLKFLKRTLSEAERLQRLIDTVLISARLQSGKPSLNLSRVNLNDILLSSFNKGKERFSENRQFEINIPIQEDDEPIYILGNPIHLSTLFDNLIDNAVKYSQKQGLIQINIILKKESVVISIKDDGVGIEKENLKKIFQKFYRIDNQEQTIVKGSGLGLSVCDSIIQEHSGKIIAQSEGLNKGSIFYVEFKRFSSYH